MHFLNKHAFIIFTFHYVENENHDAILQLNLSFSK